MGQSMTARQTVSRVRRSYNQWVANETLEDYALRFTAKRARRWSGLRVAGTALGAISFLALEAIGGAITLQYGFANAVAAILLASLIILLTAIPISYYAARYGIDSDLLTRGAGFGYLGSTITSLVYASFTFLFFALEAVILAMALELLLGLPLWIGYLLSALVVIPLVVYGITLISRFQIWTQPFWVLLQLLPFVFIIFLDARAVEDWTQFAGPVAAEPGVGGLDLLLFGAASAVIFSLVAQIGEQVDFLRFVPEARPGRRLRWWAAVMAGGPGWIVIGALKMLLGSFLAVLALGQGLSVEKAADPTHMYMIAFGYVTQSPQVALAAAGIFVVLSQVKINVTNAYAGSIAWSNFFSRLTHRHPGRVVWLVFNVCIALLVMKLGVYRAMEATLGHYGIIAISWAGALVADLVINKPLGLSPSHIEFRRAHLYDVNPVGVGAMLVAILLGMSAYLGAFGETPAALAHLLSLGVALLAAPVIAWATGGRYYLARPVVAVPIDAGGQARCCICENRFDQEDLTHCPAYAGTICSLCCSLDSRCGDVCKPGAAYHEQTRTFLRWLLPERSEHWVHEGLAQFVSVLLLINALIAAMLAFIHHQSSTGDPSTDALLSAMLWKVFFVLVIITGVLSWLFVLANESRRVAQEESNRQNRLLLDEVEAHESTDRALQEAKEKAETANLAKSRYLTGISHELRSPLNAVLGYAQLLEKDPQIPAERRPAVGVIRRSAEYLADLIEGLLDLSKIEAGRLELQYREVRMDLLLDQLVHMFRLQAQEKGLEFQFEYADRVPRWVRADEKRVRQILINLLSNAIKYTDRGRVHFTVGYRGSVAEFTVEDTGEGIDSVDLARIFLPFERLRHSGSGVSGTGLGLTITKLLCEIMGGEINVHSCRGQGSTFRVALLLSSLRTLHEHPESRDGGRLPKGYHGRRRRLLVVDDETVHRQLMVALLAPMGFEVTTLPDGDQVEAWLHNHVVDLILLDVNLPGRDGCTLLRELRGAGCRVPVVMLSASAANSATTGDGHEDPMSSGLHDGYFTKPLQLDVLVEHIGQLLRLDWLYSDSLAPVESDTGGAIPIARFDSAHRRELMELLRIGHRTGVMKLLYRMRDEDPALADSYLKLIHLAENLQFAALMELLEERKHEST
jgi:signal transduction histidine kinase/purine-cytosine permease-like protein/DNA-binding NarL/FixJ family response regulator